MCVCVHARVDVRACMCAERLLSLIMMIVMVAIFGALTEAAPPFPRKVMNISVVLCAIPDMQYVLK